MSPQQTLTGRPLRTDDGHPIADHIDPSAAVGDTYHGRCKRCGRSIHVATSGIERGHDTDCVYHGREAGDGR